MTQPKYDFFDAYGRPNHKQIYLAGGEQARGAYIDTVELAFASVLTVEQVEQVVERVHAFAGEGKVQRIAWPEEHRRIFIGLAAGYYRVSGLLSSLQDAGCELEHSGYFYSGRLGKTKADVGSLSYRRK